MLQHISHLQQEINQSSPPLLALRLLSTLLPISRATKIILKTTGKPPLVVLSRQMQGFNIFTTPIPKEAEVEKVT